MYSVKSNNLHKIAIGTGLFLVYLSLTACSTTNMPQAMIINGAPSNASVGDQMADASDAPQTGAPQSARPVSYVGQNADPRFLPIGEPVAAPTGFLEMCSRSPVDCLHSESTDLVAIRTEARAALTRKYMIALNVPAPQIKAADNADVITVAYSAPATSGPFAGASSNIIPAHPVASGEVAAAQISDQPQRLSWGRPAQNTGEIAVETRVTAPEWVSSADLAHVISDPRPGAIEVNDSDTPATHLNWAAKRTEADAPNVDTAVASDMSQTSDKYTSNYIPSRNYAAPSLIETAPAVGYVRIDMTHDMQTLIRNINDTVNQTLIADTDQDIYHVADYWTVPGLFRGKRGDCEDFALQKRRMLIESGVPTAALSMAVVKTRTGDEHAVLVIATYQGDFVLDNLQFSVKAWQKTDYTWISRQGPGDDLGWVSLTSSKNRKPQLKAAPVMVAYAQ